MAASVIAASPALASDVTGCNPGNLILVTAQGSSTVNHCYAKSGQISVRLPHVIRINPGRHSGYVAYNKPGGTPGYHAFRQWQTDELGKIGLDVVAISID